MSTVSEVLESAMALPVSDRASIAFSLLQSLPAREPKVYDNADELAAELNRRLRAIESGEMEAFPIEASLRRVHEALERSQR